MGGHGSVISVELEADGDGRSPLVADRTPRWIKPEVVGDERNPLEIEPEADVDERSPPVTGQSAELEVGNNGRIRLADGVRDSSSPGNRLSEQMPDKRWTTSAQGQEPNEPPLTLAREPELDEPQTSSAQEQDLVRGLCSPLPPGNKL
ncbi:hypothetical protein Q5P01_018733 [Channa striata]|uniref:Uncharacterized protein n=1 Tax=Channa striata TaxID=64152 RepID=A0AA88M8D4_CHASR|nr:hypothetical protein Q5P01_018733 [Channa striata]